MVALKRKSKDNHINFLKLAFEKANINLGSTKLNPSVGCVVVNNGSVLSSAVTSINGRPHAEFNALNKKKNFKGSTLYVTLEPCSHYGLTSPCVNIIKKKGIKKVYYTLSDVDPRSKDKAKRNLEKNKIKVHKKYLNKFAKKFYESYILQHVYNYPLIDAKIAISKDYKTINLKQKRITNVYSEKITHYLRTKYDCIISSSKTINKDDSILNCRIEGLENKSPDVIILDRSLKLKKNLSIFDYKKRKIYLATTMKNKKKIVYFKKKGAKILNFNHLDSSHDYIKLFAILKKKKYNRIFFECGLTLLNFLIKNKFIDNLYVFKSNMNLKKIGLNNSSTRLIKNIQLKTKVQINLYDDNLYKVNLKKNV